MDSNNGDNLKVYDDYDKEVKIFKDKSKNLFFVKKKVFNSCINNDIVTDFMKYLIIKHIQYCEKRFGNDFDALREYMQTLLFQKEDTLLFEASHMYMLIHNQTDYYGRDTRLQTYIFMNKFGIPFTFEMNLDYMSCITLGDEYIDKLLYNTDIEIGELHDTYEEVLLEQDDDDAEDDNTDD